MADTPTGATVETLLNPRIQTVNNPESYAATLAYLRDVMAPAMGIEIPEGLGFFVIYINPNGLPLPEWGGQMMS